MSKIIYSQSFIEFLKNSDCKIASLLYRLYYRQTTRYNYTSNILTDKEVNYITFRNDGTISFLPAGKELKYNDTGDWSREGRQNGKPAKVIRKILCERVQKYFKDSDFECFTNAYKANYSAEGYTFELLNNKMIPDVYEMDRGEGEGSINNSCMNGDSEYLDLYKYCDKLQILIMKNKAGLLCGRSLVWTIDENTTLMDRIYVSQDFMYDSFLNYAKKQNWWRKEHYKTYDYKSEFIDPSGNAITKKFSIDTDTTHDSYPYIDTFQYGYDGSINNYSGDYTYNNTDGTREGDKDEHDGEVYDDINDEWISEDDAVYIENGERRYRNRHCHIDNCVSVNDEWYHQDDDNIVEVGNTYYTTDSSEICELSNGDYELIDDCVYCERDNTYYLCDDCVYCEDDEEDVLRDKAIEIDDKWYHTESDKIVKIEGEYYLIDSDEVECIEGVYSLKVEEVEDGEEINEVV